MPVLETINHTLSGLVLLDAEVGRGADGQPVKAVFRARALSYDRDYLVSDNGIDHYTETWRSSSFKKSIPQDAQRGRKVPLHFNHGPSRDRSAIPLGGVTDFDDREDGLEFTARFAGITTPEVGRFAELLDMGVLRGVSIGARIYENAKDSTPEHRIRVAARLNEISLVENPALDDASVIDDEPTRTQHADTPVLDRWNQTLAELGITRDQEVDNDGEEASTEEGRIGTGISSGT